MPSIFSIFSLPKELSDSILSSVNFSDAETLFKTTKYLHNYYTINGLLPRKIDKITVCLQEVENRYQVNRLLPNEFLSKQFFIHPTKHDHGISLKEGCKYNEGRDFGFWVHETSANLTYQDQYADLQYDQYADQYAERFRSIHKTQPVYFKEIYAKRTNIIGILDRFLSKITNCATLRLKWGVNVGQTMSGEELRALLSNRGVCWQIKQVGNLEIVSQPQTALLLYEQQLPTITNSVLFKLPDCSFGWSNNGLIEQIACRFESTFQRNPEPRGRMQFLDLLGARVSTSKNLEIKLRTMGNEENSCNFLDECFRRENPFFANREMSSLVFDISKPMDVILDHDFSFGPNILGLKMEHAFLRWKKPRCGRTLRELYDKFNWNFCKRPSEKIFFDIFDGGNTFYTFHHKTLGETREMLDSLLSVGTTRELDDSLVVLSFTQTLGRGRAPTLAEMNDSFIAIHASFCNVSNIIFDDRRDCQIDQKIGTSTIKGTNVDDSQTQLDEFWRLDKFWRLEEKFLRCDFEFAQIQQRHLLKDYFSLQCENEKELLIVLRLVYDPMVDQEQVQVWMKLQKKKLF